MSAYARKTTYFINELFGSYATNLLNKWKSMSKIRKTVLRTSVVMKTDLNPFNQHIKKFVFINKWPGIFAINWLNMCKISQK